MLESYREVQDMSEDEKAETRVEHACCWQQTEPVVFVVRVNAFIQQFAL